MTQFFGPGFQERIHVVKEGDNPLHRAAHAALYCGPHGPLAGGTDDRNR